MKLQELKQGQLIKIKGPFDTDIYLVLGDGGDDVLWEVVEDQRMIGVLNVTKNHKTLIPEDHLGIFEEL
jgi:hypothetical protein